MRAVIYRPDAGDHSSGPILGSFQGSEINLGANLQAMSPAGYVAVDPSVAPNDFDRLDMTHRVTAGAIVALPLQEEPR